MLTSRVAGHTLRAASHLGRRAADAVAFMRAVVRKQQQAVGTREHVSQNSGRRRDRGEEAGAAAVFARGEVKQKRGVGQAARCFVPALAVDVTTDAAAAVVYDEKGEGDTLRELQASCFAAGAQCPRC